MAGRTPEERRRAAQERAARREARKRGEVYEPPAPPPTPGGRGRASEAFEPLPTNRRTAVVDRQPVSRAARAQRIGRPGRPTLPPSSPKPRRWFRRFLALVALLFIGAALYVINETFQPFQSENEEAGAVPVRIPAGADAGSIGDLLQSKGVVKDARFFELNATLTLRRSKLRTGNYVLRRNMTNGAAIDALMQGPKVRVVKTFKVTVPEGPSIRETAPVIGESGVEGSYAKAADSQTTLSRVRRLGAPRGTRTAEGFLFPATYDLKAGATATTLVDKQLDAFRDNFGSVDLKAAKRKNLTAYDVLKIASLIERETPSDRERPLVASVIYNRLKIGEPLNIDATIRYAEENWSRPLKVSELEKDTPYNLKAELGPAADADRQPRARLAEGGGQARADGLPVLRRQAGRVPRVRQDARRARAQRGRLRAGAGGERRQGAATEVLTYLGVAGWPVAHSRSPAMHNAALAAVGLRDWRYLKLPLPPARFAETVRALPAAGFRGINVTIPHKEAALALATEATATAAAVGAANTLTFLESGAIHADNTDVPGLLEALPIDPAGRTALVLGAGGAARAAVYALRSAGADVMVWNRTRERAERLVSDLGGRVVDAPEPASLLVNCTSVGLREQDDAFKSLPFQADTLGVGSYVADMVYRPGGTQLLVEARRRGAEVVTGLEILVAQGAASFERWTDMTAPRKAMQAAVDHHV